MLAVGPIGPQYSLLFAWHELGCMPTCGCDTLPSQKVPQKILQDGSGLALDAKQALSCLLQQKGDSKEAAQVEYLIDDLVEAGVQRIRLQKKLDLVQ